MSTPTDGLEKNEQQDVKIETTSDERAMNDQAVAAAEDITQRPGYFRSSLFLGSISAASLGLLAAISGFAFVAPILQEINDDVGPSPNITWLSILYTLTIAAGLTVVGRIGDIFSRRGVFIGGAVLGVVGSIIGATAKTVNVLIVSMLFIGLAASTQVSYFYVSAELVPVKYRFVVNAVGYIFAIPGAAFGPVIAFAAIQNTGPSWRTVYYINTAINAVALVFWVLFYHPPTFSMRHGTASKLDYLKHFDYVGLLLFVGGLVLFLMGLQWGGALHPWDSADVIATLTVGAFCLVCFLLWEGFAPLREPLVPFDLVSARAWIASVVASGSGASLYYALSLIWPGMVRTVYPSGNAITDGWVASIVGAIWALGEILSGLLAKPLGHVRMQCIVSLTLSGIFLACMATCGPGDKTQACVLIALGVFFAGYIEGLALTLTTMTLPDQQRMGSGCGFGGTIRFTITTIASTTYAVILSARQRALVPEMVSKAVAEAGLPNSSRPAYLESLTLGTSPSEIPGVNSSINLAGMEAFKQANAASYRTVFLVTIAFCALGVVATMFLPHVDALMTNDVTASLQRQRTRESRDLPKEGGLSR